MAESVPVRCPVCRREHTYTPPTYPCPCGAPVTVPVPRDGVPVRVTHRTWEDSWVDLRCASCGRHDQWPRPEWECPCGTTVRPPVVPLSPLHGQGVVSPADPARATVTIPAARVPARPAFPPVPRRTAWDAVDTAARYLGWLGFTDVRPTGDRDVTGADLRGVRVVARVAPNTRPTTPHTLERLWRNGLTETATAVCFCLTHPSEQARTRAEGLGVALFVFDHTGVPRPVNDRAERLVRDGPP